jgi:hypothetical protein
VLEVIRLVLSPRVTFDTALSRGTGWPRYARPMAHHKTPNVQDHPCSAGSSKASRTAPDVTVVGP